MKSLREAWTLYRETLAPVHLTDARVRFEIERAFYAGAEFAIDGVQDLNAAGLTIPFAITDQLHNWSSESHAARYEPPRRNHD